MSQIVRADPAALETLRTGLTSADTEMSQVTSAANQGLKRALDTTQSAVAQRRSELRRQEEALSTCRSSRAQPPPNCQPLAAAVSRARDRLTCAEQALRAVEYAVTRHQAAQARIARESSDLVTTGVRLLSTKRHQLEGYLASSTTIDGIGATALGSPSPSAGTVGFSGTGAIGALTMPPGYSMVSLNSISASDADGENAVITGPEDFTKGYSVEDLTWSFTALDTVVMPALARGEGADYFAELDRVEGLAGCRSYSSCYTGFFDPGEAVRLDPRPTGFHVGNGRHRIWLARQLGRTEIPALLSEVG
jgi:hypothetical protein